MRKLVSLASFSDDHSLKFHLKQCFCDVYLYAYSFFYRNFMETPGTSRIIHQNSMTTQSRIEEGTYIDYSENNTINFNKSAKF